MCPKSDKLKPQRKRDGLKAHTARGLHASISNTLETGDLLAGGESCKPSVRIQKLSLGIL